MEPRLHLRNAQFSEDLGQADMRFYNSNRLLEDQLASPQAGESGLLGLFEEMLMTL